MSMVPPDRPGPSTHARDDTFWLLRQIVIVSARPTRTSWNIAAAASRDATSPNAPTIVDPDPVIDDHTAPASYNRAFNSRKRGSVANTGSSKSFVKFSKPSR